MATLAELTASTVAASIRDHVDWLRPDADRADGAQVVVSGGGVHNRALMSRLRHHVSPVQKWAELGAGALGSARERPAADMISADAKEAAAFALIALRTLDGAPGNSSVGHRRDMPRRTRQGGIRRRRAALEAVI